MRASPHSHEDGGRLQLVAPSKPVRRVLVMSGLARCVDRREVVLRVVAEQRAAPGASRTGISTQRHERRRRSPERAPGRLVGGEAALLPAAGCCSRPWMAARRERQAIGEVLVVPDAVTIAQQLTQVPRKVLTCQHTCMQYRSARTRLKHSCRCRRSSGLCAVQALPPVGGGCAPTASVRLRPPSCSVRTGGYCCSTTSIRVRTVAFTGPAAEALEKARNGCSSAPPSTCGRCVEWWPWRTWPKIPRTGGRGDMSRRPGSAGYVGSDLGWPLDGGQPERDHCAGA